MVAPFLFKLCEIFSTSTATLKAMNTINMLAVLSLMLNEKSFVDLEGKLFTLLMEKDSFKDS